MAEWLLEIFSEEIPARMQFPAREQLIALAQGLLEKKKITYEDIKGFVTPRRLTLVITGLPLKIEGIVEEKKGPRVDASPEAIEGFLKTNGVRRDECEIRETEKGAFFFVVRSLPDQPLSSLISEVTANIFEQFRWPKSMRWADHFTWIRPVRHILSILDGKVIEGSYFGVQANNLTQGHRFMAPLPFSVDCFENYKKKLKERYVIPDQDERRKYIHSLLENLAKREGLELLEDDKLLTEVTGLVEWPVALVGKIDEYFMDLPDEILTTPMRHHQRYFPLKTSEGKLASRFIIIANTVTQDQGKTVIEGNERVLRARLADAQFFWEQDQKKPLLSYKEQLEKLLFHQQLGTILDKIQRIQKITQKIAKDNNIDQASADRAAILCKADLTTQMVTEFPELQGIMGKYYAQNQGESTEVSQAIEEHYWPKSASDLIPQNPISITLALADRLDSLVGFFAIGIQPTGSKDPFALRRAALGFISLTMQSPLTLNVKELLALAYEAYEWKKYSSATPKTKEDTVQNVWVFFLERLKYYLKDTQGSPHDHVDAVLAVADQAPSFIHIAARVRALDHLMKTEDGTNLSAAYKRAVNIVRIEEEKDGLIYRSEVDETKLVLPEETALYKALKEKQQGIEAFVQGQQYQEAMALLSMLRPQIDSFFDKVIVNIEDKELRRNRLSLLALIREILSYFADFSRIER